MSNCVLGLKSGSSPKSKFLNSMTTVTQKEIALFRSQLAEDDLAQQALDMIEDCEGDLEDAAMTLAIKAGQEPERDNSEWLGALCRKWRWIICDLEFREDLKNSSVSNLMTRLKSNPSFPKILAAPMLMYILQQGINDFCEPFDSIK
jgi:hypothetical protein